MQIRLLTLYKFHQIERASFFRRIQPIHDYYFHCHYQLDNEADVIRVSFSVLDKECEKIEYTRGVLIYKK